MKTIVFSICVLFCAVAGANGPFQNYPSSMTPYQILEDVFNKAGPAIFTDLPSQEEIKNKKRHPIRFLHEVEPKTTRGDLQPGYAFSRAHLVSTITLNPGKKSVGPLFPEENPTTKTVEADAILFCYGVMAICEGDEAELLKNLTEMNYRLVETPKELVVTYGNGANYSVFYRRSGDLILRKTVKEEDKKAAVVTYSYGWPEPLK